MFIFVAFHLISLRFLSNDSYLTLNNKFCMRKNYYSRKTRHIVKFSSLITATLLNCATSLAEEPASKTQIAIPSANTTSFVYNGVSQSYLSTEDTTFTIFGNSHTSAGEYEVTVSLNNTDLFEWEDGSIDSKKYTFVINKLQIEIPAADTSLFIYDGKQKAYAIAENERYTAEGLTKTNAGNHEVVVSLNDTTNCEWTDATVADKKYSFAIKKAKVEIPEADSSKFTYNSTIAVYSIEPSIHYKVSGNMQTNVGDHNVKVSLVDSLNYEWVDGTSESRLYSFNISKAQVEIPVALKDTFSFDGKIKLFEINPNDKYTVGISNESAIAVGTYSRTVSINDTENYMWADATSEPKTITFVIVEGKVKYPIVNDVVYTGNPIEFVSQSDCYNVENGNGVDAGEYRMAIGLNPGYQWEDGSKDTLRLTAKILPIKVEKPSVTSSVVTYDGTKYTINVPTNPAYSISGIPYGEEPGVYTTTVSLNPNYAWSDSTFDNQSYTLTIERIKLTIPSTDSTLFIYNQKEQTYTIEENINYSIAGNKQSEIGLHEVVVAIKDTIHYEWADATVESKHYQFEIVESTEFDIEISEINSNVTPGGKLTINLDVNGTVQYYKIRCAQLPELSDSLIDFNNESSTIQIPMPSNIKPGKYTLDVTLLSGNIDTTFTVDMAVNYPASAIIVCWNDVIAIDRTKVNSTTYQWYKDGELIPGATGQYYSDKAGLCGYYECKVDGDIVVGPVYMEFGKPLRLTAYGDKGKIIASVAGNTSANILLMSVGGMLTESKPAAKEVIFTVKPGVYVLTLDGTDQSVKVIVK